jgi:hypothetical protein
LKEDHLDIRSMDEAKSYARSRVTVSLLASLVSRLWRFKSIFIRKSGKSEVIPQIFYPYPIVYILENSEKVEIEESKDETIEIKSLLGAFDDDDLKSEINLKKIMKKKDKKDRFNDCRFLYAEPMVRNDEPFQKWSNNL